MSVESISPYFILLGLVVSFLFCDFIRWNRNRTEPVTLVTTFNRLCGSKPGYLMILVVGIGMAGIGMLAAEILRYILSH